MTASVSSASVLSLPDAGNEPNQWLTFRHRCVLETLPETVHAHLAADSKYWLWINGALIIREGGLKQTAGPGRIYVDTVDLRPHLRMGENTVAVLLWYFGRSGISHFSTAQPAFRLNAAECHQISTTTAWRVTRHRSFSTCEALQPNYRLPESSITYDARREPGAWTDPGFDDSSWDHAVDLPKSAFGGSMSRPIPPFWFGPRQTFGGVECRGDRLVGVLPWNQQFTSFLRIRAPAGLAIDLFTDTHAVDGKRHHQSVGTRYITREGEQEFETFAWMSGHEAYFVVPEGVEVLELGYRPTAFSDEFVGTYHCDDSDLNCLWEKCQRTLSICLRDGYMDCPDRERGLYLGDAVNTIAQTFYTYGSPGRAMAAKTLREVCAWQRADGALYAPLGGDWTEELGPQSLLFAGYYGAWQIYLHTGEQDLLAATFPALRRFVDLWARDPECGLALPRTGDWNWTDWGNGIDEEVIRNALLILAYRGLAAMARELERSELTAQYSQAEKSLQESLHAAFFDGELYRSKDFTGPADDRAIALVVLADAAPPGTFPALTAHLLRHETASPYMERFVLEALFRMRQPEAAMERMRRRYAAWIESPCTTLPEQWERPPGTDNHAWSGAPLHLLPQYLLGVMPLEPGFSRFAVRPQLLQLTKIAGQVPTPHGPIRVDLSHEGWQFIQEVVVPPGTSAEVSVPGEFVKQRLKVNGHRYKAETSGFHPALVGIKPMNNESPKFTFHCSSGRWLFEAF